MRDRLDQVAGRGAMGQRQFELCQPEANIGRGDGDSVGQRAPERRRIRLGSTSLSRSQPQASTAVFPALSTA
jgi:hypothetical protein